MRGGVGVLGQPVAGEFLRYLHEFLAKARNRLNELVERSGILVFASHSDEFLADLCDTAIWMDQGQIREHGPLREVLHHYKGRDVLAELESR